MLKNLFVCDLQHRRDLHTKMTREGTQGPWQSQSEAKTQIEVENGYPLVSYSGFRKVCTL